ncbi:MAG TPA: hypothetical protein DCE14_06405 [Kosmotogaceae bacterium]|nr:MAG: Ribosomal protein L11 methyltransferase [Thermotogales bacterium 46_20]HAA85959.1 hypothetical protein [Kosmotogaceae bacterium]
MRREVSLLIEYIHFSGIVSQEQKDLLQEDFFSYGFNEYYIDEDPENTRATLHIFLSNASQLPNWLESITLQRQEEGLTINNWIEEWKKSLKPIRLTDRITVVPVEQPPKIRQTGRIYLIPGLAFGTGSHESTRLAARLLEAAEPLGKRVLDIGCGSGILSSVAFLLGAKSVVALDNDPLALEKTAEIAEINEICLDIRKSDLVSSLREDEDFDLIVANLNETLLCSLKESIIPHMAEKGRLVISGILKSNEELVRSALRQLFEFTEVLEEGDWVSSILTKRLSSGR